MRTIGNIVSCRDDSHNRVFTTSGPVEPVQDYVYDAQYRLIHATGRMHLALADTPFFNDPLSFKQSRHTLLNDQSLIAAYGRNYLYDAAGNLTQISQTGTNPFTREITVHDDTNRALMKSTGFEPDASADWEALGYFDPNGNQTRFDHLDGAAWNYRDNIASVTIIDRSGNDDAEYYVYDAGGQRARKVKETFESGETVKRVVDKIYLGGVEVKRIRTVEMNTLVETQILDRSDLHVMDDKQRIAIVTHWTQDDLLTEIEDPSWLNSLRIRQQLGNHLGSASLELDQTGRIISYEEYYPYGGTSFIAGDSQKEVGLKEYRYTGKERDDSTGFYYYGQRYYAPWLGRWMSADPAGPVDGLNLYEYVSSNPVKFVDPTGNEEKIPWLSTLISDAAESLATAASEGIQKVEQAVLESSPFRSEATDTAVTMNFAVHSAATEAAISAFGMSTAALVEPLETPIKEPVEVYQAVKELASGDTSEGIMDIDRTGTSVIC